MGDKISNLWHAFSERDPFTKTTIIIAVIFALVTPVFIAQKTNLFIGAANSLYSTCIVPPAGFNQQELDMLAQSKHINWCKTLAQSTVGVQNYQDTTPQTPSSNGQDPLATLGYKMQQLLTAVRKLFTGQ